MKTQMYDGPREVWLVRSSRNPWDRPRPSRLRLIGETSRSWLTSGDHPWSKPYCWAKNSNVIISPEEAESILWDRAHRYKISKEVEGGNDATVLRQIAALIGYREGA